MKIPIKNQMIVLLQNKDGITQMTNLLVLVAWNNKEDMTKLNYDFNTTDMLNNNDINCFMTKNEIYNKVKLHIEVKSFGSFPPSNDIIKNLPFAIDNINHQSSTLTKKRHLTKILIIWTCYVSMKKFILVITLFDVFYYG